MSDLMAEVQPMIPALRRYARGLLRDAAAADDAVQDCLERVVAHWHRRRDGNPRPWVFTILHNVAVNQMRQRVRRGIPAPIEDAPAVALATRATQEDRLVRGDILAALALLPEEQRSTVLLISVEDMSYAEAAQVLGVPVGTVMSRLSRGRERLRVILEERGLGAPQARPRPHLRSLP
ncbi:RNA polymerase sigma factor [Paracoccus suum]|uniref:RNA polymerase sigma factor n=1 Tax=Paracoccus suum TaxID=2259340 RepID=A0A344PMQ0_9RHOB|nr:RNA polymerase sigma factor [Paracoccus suum]AXC50655.1 RNA polymerase sigma factor [Paracoccus suum]